MGTTIKAELSYGYRLQGDDGRWLVREVHPEDSDEWGLNLDWYEADEDEDNFDDEAEKRLLASVGFTETDYNVDGYFDRQRAAKSRLGVRLDRTGYEAGDLMLVTTQYGAYLGEAEPIDPAVLAAETSGPADERLRNALAVLGLTPLQEQPAWLLTAYRG
jgi:hypothetical protein